MAVPDYQSLMLPMLRLTADGAEHRLADLVRSLVRALQLGEVDGDQDSSSGQRVIYNRTHWAATYLTQGWSAR